METDDTVRSCLPIIPKPDRCNRTFCESDAESCTPRRGIPIPARFVSAKKINIVWTKQGKDVLYKREQDGRTGTERGACCEPDTEGVGGVCRRRELTRSGDDCITELRDRVPTGRWLLSPIRQMR